MRILLISIISFLLASFSAFAFMNDSTENNGFTKETAKEKGIDMILAGGLGMTTGYNRLGNDLKNGPIISLGLELPFTKSHFFALELATNCWIARTNNRSKRWEESSFVYYINDDLVSNGGITIALKLYFTSSKSRLRFAISYGRVIISPFINNTITNDGMPHEFGLGIYYMIDKDLRLSLVRKGYYAPGANFTNGSYDPNSLMLNICYNFKW